ncbi:predicted protein [Histoplasma capsulatum G186AR]|uniref:Uncharacterized protein n=1 Tax=Ajellomyces capsulatus (strain G186AR / H82 / ATCC MYA-2454 / RMSCC 2432) TaxID=447093 RepID=C0NP47_AJECG|nr:uncharacterized protein HCBG_04927 [Histoplasma capsulatum G186AR]EEH06707.1 predicted protein [Histoplasma capsulatum G186AR]
MFELLKQQFPQLLSYGTHTPPADDHATFLSSILQVYIVAVEPRNNQANLSIVLLASDCSVCASYTTPTPVTSPLVAVKAEELFHAAMFPSSNSNTVSYIFGVLQGVEILRTRIALQRGQLRSLLGAVIGFIGNRV